MKKETMGITNEEKKQVLGAVYFVLLFFGCYRRCPFLPIDFVRIEC